MARHPHEHHVLTDISVGCILSHSQLHIYEGSRPDCTFLGLAEKYYICVYETLLCWEIDHFYKRNCINFICKNTDTFAC